MDKCTRCHQQREIIYTSIIGTRWCLDCCEAVREGGSVVLMSPAPTAEGDDE